MLPNRMQHLFLEPGNGLWRNPNQDRVFPPVGGFRVGGIDSEDMKNLQQVRSLEKSEARSQLFPRLQLPPWGNRQRRYEKSPTGQTVGESESRLSLSPRLQLPRWGNRQRRYENLQQVRLLEESEARSQLFPRLQLPPWENRQQRYEKSPTGQGCWRNQKRD